MKIPSRLLIAGAVAVCSVAALTSKLEDMITNKLLSDNPPVTVIRTSWRCYEGIVGGYNAYIEQYADENSKVFVKLEALDSRATPYGVAGRFVNNTLDRLAIKQNSMCQGYSVLVNWNNTWVWNFTPDPQASDYSKDDADSAIELINTAIAIITSQQYIAETKPNLEYSPRMGCARKAFPATDTPQLGYEGTVLK